MGLSASESDGVQILQLAVLLCGEVKSKNIRRSTE